MRNSVSNLANFLDQYQGEVQVMNNFRELESFLHEKIDDMLNSDFSNEGHVLEVRAKQLIGTEIL